MPKIEVRAWTTRDVSEMRTILNDIIEIGGTTALERPFTDHRFTAYFLDETELYACFVAIDAKDAVAGFQMLHRHPALPEDWADVATFARGAPKISGVGTALFARTLAFAAAAGIAAINATIRADNRGGLAFYDRLGFETYAVAKGAPLADGALVDRISKRRVVG